MIKAYVRLGEKYYTVKEWKKFDYPHQSVLLRKFDIILTDHMTPREKVRVIGKKLTIKNLIIGVDKFSNTIDEFGKIVNQINVGKQNDISGLIGNEKKDFKGLI